MIGITDEPIVVDAATFLFEKLASSPIATLVVDSEVILLTGFYRRVKEVITSPRSSWRTSIKEKKSEHKGKAPKLKEYTRLAVGPKKKNHSTAAQCRRSFLYHGH